MPRDLASSLIWSLKEIETSRQPRSRGEPGQRAGDFAFADRGKAGQADDVTRFARNFQFRISNF